MKIVYMFSGQGSQYYHMGEELYQHNQIYKHWMNKLDGIYQGLTGQSVVQQLYNKQHKKNDIFNELMITHPAIFMVEYALAQVLIDMGIYPDAVIGSSLGEYTACAVAGVMGYEDIMECLIHQVRLIEKYCDKGGMIAIIDDPKNYHQTPTLYNNSQLVAVNFHTHYVVSGDISGINIIKEYLKEHKIAHEVIPVQYGFHSSYVEYIEPDYLKYLSTKTYNKPKVDIISSLTGNKVNTVNQRFLWEVIRQPIEFRKALKQIHNEHIMYIDLGPSGTLGNFAKYILKDKNRNISSIMSPFGHESKKIKTLHDSLLSKCNLSIGKVRITMKAYVFAGQGSQSKGMGEGLFDKFPELTAIADEILGYSIKDLCLEDREGNLRDTQYTQPALYVVNAFMYLQKVKETGISPDYVAGHSLGEYSALYAAGVFDFETGLKIVKKRGAIMSLAKNGGMAAVIGLTQEKVHKVLTDNEMTSIDIANINTPSQIVISGPKEDIVKAQHEFESAGAFRYMILNVSGAFHSRYMEQSKKEFATFLQDFSFKKPTIPVIANYTARPYKQANLINNMIEQISGSVKWVDSIRYLMGQGDIAIEQIGPGNVLVGMIKTIQRETEPLIVEDIEEETEDIESNETSGISATTLGSDVFKQRYGLKYAYLTGGMYRGIASKEMVVKVGKKGMLGFLGTGGMKADQIQQDIQYIQNQLQDGQVYGVNLISFPSNPTIEEDMVSLYIRNNVRIIEASAFMTMTQAIVKYRIQGIKRIGDGTVLPKNRIIAKVSRPEVAELFLSPAPKRLIDALLSQHKISEEEAKLSQEIPMADDITIEADSGGHTDCGVAYALMPAIIKLRDSMVRKYNYKMKVGIGAAGGIGTPEAAAAACILGADYIVTGSINQCTVEADTSERVKELLQHINVQDTDYAPAGDMFEMGSKVQVLKKGLFFPARANKLYELYRQYNSLEAIDEKTRKQIQDRYFKKTFDEVFVELKAYYSEKEIEKAKANPKYKMALVFKWYFNRGTHLALTGDEASKVDYQIHCGPALGAFNQWVKGTQLETWKERHVDEIGLKLMDETAMLLKTRYQDL